MYSDAFCRAYNALGWNYFPEAVGEQLLQWMAEQRLSLRSALDLGCGTGVLCEKLREGGMEVMGMDLSENMIAIARARQPEIPYEVADMVTWRPARRFDLVTCTGDALNHIHSLEAVARVFENVRAALNPGGWFVFDLLNEREIDTEAPIDLDFDADTRAQFSMERMADGVVQLRVAVLRRGEPPLEEVITERVHNPDAVCGLLARAGFAVRRRGHRLSQASEGMGLTWFIVAQRE